MIGHHPTLGRRRLGRKTYGTGGDQWGTTVRCECGWQANVNQAPSSGGNAEAIDQWYTHLRTDVLGHVPGGYWSDLGLRLRRRFYCQGYTVTGRACGARATRRFGRPNTMATVVLCTRHAKTTQGLP